MEPQLFSCGLADSSTLAVGQYERFNGAATFQLRIAPGENVAEGKSDASMEPQLFSCGLFIKT